MSDPDLPIALRPIGAFPPTGASVFEDPGDEKSWHISQRAESLARFYEGRDPSWYASAIRPLAGARRALDLGCGPGLTLRALRDQGAEQVLGIDRWSAFARAAAADTPIIVHDLTLPMPFIASGSFDAVFSHYALDYVSPIGMRQVLREAHRILAPGGRLLIYVAAVGLGSGDVARTVPYSAATMRDLLEEARFVELDVVASPNGRNTVAAARRAGDRPPAAVAPITAVDGEVQLSAAFESTPSGSLEFVVRGADGKRQHRIDVEPGNGESIAACARIVADDDGHELHSWVWRGGTPVAAEVVRLHPTPAALEISAAGRALHVDIWAPRPRPVEPIGSAYVSASELTPAADLDEASRGAEGRLLVVEGPEADPAEIARAIGGGQNRFRIRRPGRDLQPAELDREWEEGAILGVVIEAEFLAGPGGLECLRWAGERGALLLVEGRTGGEIGAAARECGATVLLVDPALHDAENLGGEAELAAGENLLVVLGSDTPTPAALTGRVLTGGPPPAGDGDAAEILRYLTERALLARLRHASGLPPAELGRRSRPRR